MLEHERTRTNTNGHERRFQCAKKEQKQEEDAAENEPIAQCVSVFSVEEEVVLGGWRVVCGGGLGLLTVTGA